VAAPTGALTGVSQLWRSGLLPLVYGEELFWSFRVTGPSDAFADLDVIGRNGWSDFDGGADKENFVHDVEHFRAGSLAPSTECSGLPPVHDGIARNAGRMLVASGGV